METTDTSAETVDVRLHHVVDTHVHFWDRRRNGLRYDWLADDAAPTALGDLDGLRAPRFSVGEYRAESRFQNVSKVVHMDAAAGTPDPVAETAWLQSLGDATGWPNAIVASCDLADPRADEALERHARHGNLRGIRDFRPAEIFDTDAFRRGYTRLAQHDLMFFHTVGQGEWKRARDLVARFPDIVFCLDQSGVPERRDDEYYRSWRRGLGDLAREPNVVCKVSSLGMHDPSWTVASRRRWVLGCIDAFGTDRCFFGSNWPVERLYSSYTDVARAFREIISDFTAGEQAQLLAGNAERVFRI